MAIAHMTADDLGRMISRGLETRLKITIKARLQEVVQEELEKIAKEAVDVIVPQAVDIYLDSHSNPVQPELKISIRFGEKGAPADA